MRQMPMRTSPLAALLCIALFGAGCATVQVSQPSASTEDTPAEVNQRAAHWRFDAARPPAERDGYRPPAKLAVLLPLSGSLATAAAPVRDGLLAGYYAEQRQRPELVFYDTAGTGAGATAAYAKALGEGADQIVGPLGREEIDAVYGGVQVGAPPLVALNHGTNAPPANVASFSLAPEDDGAGAADFLLSRNAKRVLVLAGDGDYARRSVAAFAKRLQEKGGAVAQTLPVYGDKPDIAAALLAATQAQGGADAAGVDAVFLALRGGQARAIAPQLAAAGLTAKPRVATSQLTSGTGEAERDRALDGIAFPTDIWSVTGTRRLPNARLTGQSLPTARGAAAKLFAFGYDAWLLSTYLEHLALNDEARIEGATGLLQIDADGNIVRTPAWSTFSNGAVVPLAGAGG
jgi:outer membrane PBP1 activator LpoA protein